MTTFTIELLEEEKFDIQQKLVQNMQNYSKNLFLKSVKIKEYRENKVLHLLDVYSKNLVYLYLSRFYEELSPDITFLREWEDSNIQISIEDFEEFNNSLTPEINDLFFQIENKLFSVKQVNKQGEAINLTFIFTMKNLEFKYLSLKKAIAYYILAN